MSTALMTESIGAASQHSKGRSAGFFWLMTILTGTFATLVYGRLVEPGNAAATAANISAHEALFRSGVAAGLLATACYIAATMLVYAVLRPVNRDLSLLAALFSLVGLASGAVSFVFRLAPLLVQGGAQYLNILTVEQWQALTLMFLRLRTQAGNISFLFFALHCLLVGYLILNAPRRARGTIPFPVASREGRERSTLGGAGQRNGGMATG